MIRVEHLEKTFRVARHRGGVLGAVRSLFDRQTREVRAVDGISFVIQPGEMVAASVRTAPASRPRSRC